MSVLPIQPASIQEADDLNVGSWGEGDCPFEVSPSSYIDDARLDLDEKSDRGNRNATHNAKRAIICGIDWIFVNLGLVKGKKLNIPGKLERLRSLNIVSPAIINRIVRQRNFLEHEYKTGSRADAEDAVDVAELFVHATEKWTSDGDSVYVEFWHSALRIGGDLDLSKSSVDAPAGITYYFYGSRRSDALDPRAVKEGSAEERGILDLGSSGRGNLTHVDGETYVGFLRCILIARMSPR